MGGRGMTHNPDYSLIALRVKEYRTAKQMSQAELAEHTDMSTPFISYIETAKKKASLKSLWRIAQALGTTVDAFLYANEWLKCI